jgi:ribonucleotide reductase alpha subunit
VWDVATSISTVTLIINKKKDNLVTSLSSVVFLLILSPFNTGLLNNHDKDTTINWNTEISLLLKYLVHLKMEEIEVSIHNLNTNESIQYESMTIIRVENGYNYLYFNPDTRLPTSYMYISDEVMYGIDKAGV